MLETTSTRNFVATLEEKEGHLAGYLFKFMSRALFLQNLDPKSFPGRL